jgi:hypothetical protein
MAWLPACRTTSARSLLADVTRTAHPQLSSRATGGMLDGVYPADEAQQIA